MKFDASFDYLVCFSIGGYIVVPFNLTFVSRLSPFAFHIFSKDILSPLLLSILILGLRLVGPPHKGYHVFHSFASPAIPKDHVDWIHRFLFHHVHSVREKSRQIGT